MISRLALAAVVVVSSLTGAVAASVVTAVHAQAPVVAPTAAAATAVAPARFEHYCAAIDAVALRLAGQRGWELVSAYSTVRSGSLSGSLAHGIGSERLTATLSPVSDVTYCFKRPMP
jgi:hypothetical protein